MHGLDPHDEIDYWRGQARRAMDECAALRRELERWRHGVTVEGDYVCPDSLALAEMTKARDRLADIAESMTAPEHADVHAHIAELRKVGTP